MAAGAGTYQNVEAFEDRGNSVSMQVAVKNRSVLVLSDSWYPGWTASVDGHKQPIFRANFLFRGVFLEPGAHRVEFEYRPFRFTVGICICALSAAICGALIYTKTP